MDKTYKQHGKFFKYLTKMLWRGRVLPAKTALPKSGNRGGAWFCYPKSDAVHDFTPMVLNNWFNTSEDNQAHRLKQPLDEPPHASTVDLTHPSADLVDEKPAQRAATTLSTPHDAVLAELHSCRPKVDPSKKPFLPEDPPHDQGRPNNPYPASPNISTPNPEPLFDPFTGAHIGDLIPGECEQNPDSNTDEELWTHLSKISKLQSDIADMHIKMEGIGLKKPGPTPNKSKAGGINRRPSTSGGREWGEGVADEGVDDEDDEEAENKRKREEEFSKLNDKFTGRKDAIDGIMKNVRFKLGLWLMRCSLRLPLAAG